MKVVPILRLSIFCLIILAVLLLAAFLYKNVRTYVPAPEVIITSTPTQIPEDLIDLERKIISKLSVADKFKSGVFATEREFALPEGFQISLFAKDLGDARFFVFDSGDNAYLTDRGGGRLLFIKDTDSDGVSDETIVVDKGLDTPHGIDLYKGDLYVAEETRVVVYKDINNGKYSEKKTLISNLPSGGHATRTVIVGPDEKLYLSIGSSCNVCVESDKRRAAVVRYNLDGTGETLFASGLRNSVGILFHTENGETKLWSVENGRDRIGDDIPPEEVNIVEEGKNYGWPYCHGNGENSPEYKDRVDYCKTTTYPYYSMQAHSAPLGFNFAPDMEKGNFPASLKNFLFIAFHGSWNRTEPTGYKVVYFDRSGEYSALDREKDFITGWQDKDEKVWGRPVDIRFNSKGEMFVSDDKAGALYRIRYAN